MAKSNMGYWEIPSVSQATSWQQGPCLLSVSIVLSINFNKCFSNESLSMWMNKRTWLRKDAGNLTSQESLIKTPSTPAGIFTSREVTLQIHTM